MNKAAIFAAAAIAASIGLQSAAHAGQQHVTVKRIEHRHDLDSALAAGLIGAVAGVVIGNAIDGKVMVDHRRPAHPPRHWHKPHHPKGHHHPRRADKRVEPWTGKWFSYCRATYRSFNPRTGTYRGYDGRTHFCEVPRHRWR